MIRRESTTHSEASNAAFAWCNPNGMENPVSEILRNRQASCESAFLFIGWANRKPYRILRPDDLTMHVAARPRISRRGSARSSILGHHRDEYREVGLCPPILADDGLNRPISAHF